MNITSDEKLKEIILLMREKGYDPVAQLTGYIEIGSDEYITRYGNARKKIKEIDKSFIKRYIENQKNS